ncbi:hypothetical protein PGT21_022159 [Puccinia graminis f. sp. tritici]|uniref:Uncharacterized protein n=1 Tax=Puccinia graminis f. sp. tritici TaxID=56615 RepID=A0A5B0M1K4_PUCGR|nr:hypothetical protein PGT21_022159 [Puccinia graminis f. sp. tritici]KAA1125750.1 hypothetical protein PGTUg99_013659 [Puccinia graminis f. sp. tritici]
MAIQGCGAQPLRPAQTTPAAASSTPLAPEYSPRVVEDSSSATGNGDQLHRPRQAALIAGCLGGSRAQKHVQSTPSHLLATETGQLDSEAADISPSDGFLHALLQPRVDKPVSSFGIILT